MASSQVNISNRQTVIILWQLGGFLWGFTVFTKPTFACVESTGSFRGSGIHHLSKTMNTGGWCSNSRGGLIIVAAGKLATRTASCRSFLHDRSILLSLFRHRTFPRLRQLAKAVMWVAAIVLHRKRVFSVAGFIVNVKRSTRWPTKVNKIILFTTTLVLLD